MSWSMNVQRARRSAKIPVARIECAINTNKGHVRGAMRGPVNLAGISVDGPAGQAKMYIRAGAAVQVELCEVRTDLKALITQATARAAGKWGATDRHRRRGIDGHLA